MKKKSLFLFIATTLLTISVFAASGVWYVVSDSCGKCLVNYVDRKCGKCGGSLEQKGASRPKGNFLESTYKCKDCHHTCIFKVKYK